ncbi:MAG TPA: glycosyltransferase, partial [Thermoanaerobaculia bacterium]|nr:glycosyltransferase [Thermoanaerobaculia bacterium]
RAHAGSPNLLLRTLALLPKSVYLAERLAEIGVRHLHAHYATHPATAALVVSELSGIPWSMTVHAHDLFVRRQGLALKLRRARFVRAISRFNRSFLAARWPEATGKVAVVHVGVEPERYAAAARAAASEEAAEDAPPRLVCVAALKPYKGHAVLLRAYARLRDAGVPFACELIGEGPLRAKIEASIAALGLGERVRLAGALPEDEVARRLAGAAAVVLPSVVARDGQMEGIPVALMEAMAAGRPVVASDLSGVSELVEHETNGLLVPPGDAAALAAAIRRLLADPAYGAELGRRGRETVEREFRLDRTVAALRALLDRDAPAPDPDLAARLAAATWPPLRERAVGLRRLHRREDSWVAELLLAGGTDEAAPREVVLKVQRSRPGESYPAPARARREHEALRCLKERLGGEESPFGVPRALHLDEAAATVVMEACRGRPLDAVIREGRAARAPARREELADALHRAGGWLAAFQRATAGDGDGREALATLLARAERDLEACSGDLPAGQARRLQERLAIGAGATDRAALRLTGHHGDFWPGNVFVAPERVEVIDFEGTRRGLPEEDAAFFLVELELFFAWPGLARRFTASAAAFLAPLDGLDRDLLALCRVAKALQVLACGPASGDFGGRRRRRALRRRLLAEARA